MMSKTHFVSVIIPTYNEGSVIETLLLSLLKQSYPKIEIIVVDDGSSDNTASIAKKYTHHVYKRKHAERSVQRNFGSRKAKGKYLLFLDADMKLTKNVISDCVEMAAGDRRVGGVVIPEESEAETFWEKVKAYERSFYNKKGYEVTDAARFFTRDVFNKAGGYDEKITGPEDWDFPETVRKMGYKITRIQSKIVHYERVPGLFKLARKKYYYALKSHVYLKKQNISPIGPKTIYFLRPVFYKDFKKLLLHPVLTISMFTMFTFELIGGAVGFIVGKYLIK